MLAGGLVVVIRGNRVGGVRIQRQLDLGIPNGDLARIPDTHFGADLQSDALLVAYRCDDRGLASGLVGESKIANVSEFNRIAN
jgi:hypothetical protein